MTSELARRIAFTLGALLIYRLGSHIPLPGVNYSDPGLNRSFAPVSIFSIGILPYLTAAILIQLVSMVSSRLGVARDSEAGRRKIARYTLALAALLAAFQSYGIATGLEAAGHVVGYPGLLFRLSTAVTLTGGAIFLIWLSQQITARGIGNGIAMILFAGVAVAMPRAVAAMLVLVRQGVLSPERVTFLFVLWVALVGLAVFVELARRRVPVEFAARNLGDRLVPAQSSHLPFKLNNAGLLPTVVVPWLFSLLLLAGLLLAQIAPELTAVFGQFQLGHLGWPLLYSVAIVIFAFIYTAFVVDPERAAVSLNKLGGAIPGVAPGEPTAEHLDRVVSYTTCVGALYLAAIFLIPELLVSYSQVPFYLGGASVLIVVCAVLDIERQVRGLTLTRPGGEYS
jgi:preprotein translocase subunit SecY